MPKLFIFITVFSVSVFQTKAQKTHHYNLVQLLKENKLVTNPNQETQTLHDSIRKKAISTKGIVWLKDVSFTKGTIEVDLRGKNVFLQSFLGIAFHGVDSATYDAIYFRPFNFKYPDTARRRWSIQYFSMPDYDYDRLRKESPLVYENAVTPVPNPDSWFHATIVIGDDSSMVYVNHSATASLKVKFIADLHIITKKIKAMIIKMTHVCVYVLNQESAFDFYTNKLGFKVKMDVPMGKDARWLTVTPPEQPELEITLFPVAIGTMFNEETAKLMKELISKGIFGPGVFTCKDIYATYEELKSKGVEFKKPPTKEFYGTEALFKDDSGNWFSLAQLV